MSTLATATETDLNLRQTLNDDISIVPRRNALSYALLHRSLRVLHRGGSTQNTKMGLGGHLSDPANIFAEREKQNIQIVALVFSSLGVACTLVTIYWFFMMKRNFRRQLILLLIMGDLFKSLWYLLFSSAALGGYTLSTDTVFCQANGFLLQCATESCDMAILLMSIHMSLQIFSPNSKTFGRDGLYRFRHTAMILWVLLPTLSASLGFVRADHAYILQGAFCTLPIRPYWYRLALTWIPRYLVWAYIMYVAFGIYIKVGRGFKVFAREAGNISSCGMTTETENAPPPSELKVIKKRPPPLSLGQDLQSDGGPATHSTTGSTVASPMETDRFAGGFHWPSSPGFGFPSPGFGPSSPGLGEGLDGSDLAAGGKSRRGSRVAFGADSVINADHLQIPMDQKLHMGSISTLFSLKSNGDISVDGNRHPILEPIEEGVNGRQEGVETDLESAEAPLDKQRRAIQRQLRLLFIYPSVYMIMWTIPFAYHSMNYSNYYAQHPVYILGLLATLCQCALGCVDCTVFGWREKPWKHIPGSDGTFLGSFMFWRFHQAGSEPQGSTHIPDEPGTQGGVQTIRSRLSLRSSSYTSMNHTAHRKTFSGSSDRSALEYERAAERLALERAERGRSLPHSRTGSMATAQRPASVEWWERRLSQAVLETPAMEKDDFDLH